MTPNKLDQIDWPSRVKALKEVIKKNKLTNYRIAQVSGLNITTVGRILRRKNKSSRSTTIDAITSAVMVLATKNGGKKCLKEI